MTTPKVELQANKLKPVHPKPQHDKILYCQRATSQIKDARLSSANRRVDLFALFASYAYRYRICPQESFIACR